MALIKKIFLFLVLIFIFTLIIRNFSWYQKTLDFYNQYQKEFEKEKKKNVNLKTQLVRKKSLIEIEKTIRDKLNLTKENEYVIIIPSLSPAPPTITPTPLPNYLQWWYLFAKK
ncbi:MAG: septum formation initiator family protein [Microgenomates group bacterium]